MALAIGACLALLLAVAATALGAQPTPGCRAAPGEGLTLANVASAGGTVRVVGSNGLIARSGNLTRWQVEATPIVHNLRGITWTGRRWVAVGDVGSVLYRRNRSWIAAAGIPNSGLRGVASRPGLVAAAGSGGVLLTSSDGVSWTVANSGTTGLLWGGTRVGSMLLFSGQASTVIASGDGVDWRQLSSFPFPTGNPVAPRPLIWQLASSGPEIVAVGDFGAILEGTLASGLRAVHSPTEEILRSVTHGAGRWVVAGSGGTLLFSRDGKRWIADRSPTDVDLRGVAWTGRRFVAVGDEGTVISSADGRSWRMDTSAMPCALLGLARGNGTFVAVGGGGRLQLSRDGRWRRVSSPTSRDLYAIARGPARFVAVGAKATVLTSGNGLRWMRRPVPARLNLHAVAWTGSEYLAGGDRGVLLSSPDGLRWRRLPFPGFHSIRSFATDGTSVIAAGAGTVARLPAPGDSWQLEPVGLGRFQTGVAYGGGRYVVVGHNGGLLVSTDGGASWTAAVSGITQNLDAIIWTGGRFTATGEGIAITSQDGSHWQQTAVPGHHSIRALAGSGLGVVVGVGDESSHLLLAPRL
jgi:hypothetical protein